MILQCNLSWCIHDINERYCNFNSINNSSIPFHSLFIVLRALCFLLHHHCKHHHHHHQRQGFLQDLSHFLFPYQLHITHYLSTMNNERIHATLSTLLLSLSLWFCPLDLVFYYFPPLPPIPSLFLSVLLFTQSACFIIIVIIFLYIVISKPHQFSFSN